MPQSVDVRAHVDPHGWIRVTVKISALAPEEAVWVMAQDTAQMFAVSVLGRSANTLADLPRVLMPHDRIEYHYIEHAAPAASSS